MSDITVIILTKNEEKNIKASIISSKQIAERIIVVDSGSNDKTIEIAKELGAEVYYHEWEGHAKQFNWALDNCSVKTEWVFRLDADERISKELACEINQKLKSTSIKNVDGYEMRWRIYFMGKWIRHGGTHKPYFLRLFRYGKGRVENKLMDEHIIVNGKVSTVVASYLCIYKTTILMADQKGYLVTKVAIYTNFIKTILQIISIIVWKNYIIFLSVGTIITIGNNVYASRIADKTYQFINKKSTISNYEKKHIFNNLGSVFLYKVSAMLLNATDNILISILISTAMVGYYSNYLLLQTKIVAIISLVFTSMTASIGNLIVTENSEKRFKVFKCEQSISCFICGIVVPCYILLADDFIRIWLGSEYQLGFAMSCAVGLNMYLSCVMQPLWSYREATGLYRKTKWIMVICAMINIGLSIILGKTIVSA